MESAIQDFFRGDYMPHGHCYLWQPGILWTNVISDLIIALAYFSIPVVIVIFAHHRKGEKFNNVLILFALFILTCGVTHIFSIYTIWHGSYGVHGMLKAATAIVSATTAFVLFRNLDKIIAIPTPREMQNAQQKIFDEKIKNAELEIENKANSIFKFSLELIPTGVLVIDSSQHIIIANQALEAMFEYQHEELVGKHLSVLIGELKDSKHRALADNFIKQGTHTEMAEGRLVWGETKVGNEIPIEVSLSKHEVNEETYTFASVTSVNKVGLQRRHFVEVSRRMSRAVEATDVGIWEWNTLTDEVWFSPRLLELLLTDKSQEQASFSDWKNHIHPDDLQMVEEKLNDHLNKGETYDVVYRGRSSNNEYRWLRTTGDSVFDDSGRAILMSGTITDVDQFQTLQNELIRSNEELEQFAYVASHDLKEPLRTLRTYTSYLISDMESNKLERIKQDKEFIDDASSRMTKLIDDLLSFTRVGRSDFNVEPVSIDLLVKNIISDFHTTITEQNTQIVVQPELPTINSDPSQLRIVMQNIIHNAIKFSRNTPKPTVTISYESSENDITIYVQDNGIGIAEEHQEQIFGLFKRLHSLQEYEGTGLGLAIVQKILLRLGGTIAVDSSIEKGTKMIIKLPQSEVKHD